MNLSSIEIHEFSTGIIPERVGDGWISRGFTGEYINKTIEAPRAVLDAIANREFALAEGASRDKPAIIGREVSGYGESWSVVAVVIKGRDEFGRSASMYRYFLCEGLQKVNLILAWMYSQRPLPVFNPFDNKTLGRPNIYSPSNTPPPNLRPELQNLLNNSSPVIVPWTENCTAIIIHEMAGKKIASEELISWAFNVEALEKPTRFHVIQAASEKAEQLLQKMLATTPRNSVNIAGEQAIKTAIKGLISRENVKLDQVLTLDNALANPQINADYWKTILDGQGASQARTQAIYSPQTVRLMTLQAILIPETLPEYLAWMSKRGKQDDHFSIADSFQAEIYKAIQPQARNIINNVVQSVKLLIPALIKSPELVPAAVWLLNSSAPPRLWNKFYIERVLRDIENDFNLMSQGLVKRREQNFSGVAKREQNLPLSTEPEWEKLLNELKRCWFSQNSPQLEKYQPLADLFEGLDNSYPLAAFFSHVAYGKGQVSKQTFSQLPTTNSWHSKKVYGIEIQRKVSLPELLFLALMKKIEIRGNPMRVWSAIIVLIIFTSLGFGGGWLVGKATPPNGHNSQNKTSLNSNEDTDNYPQNKTPSNTEIEEDDTNRKRSDIAVPSSPKEPRKSLEPLEQIIIAIRNDGYEGSTFQNLDIERGLLSVLDLQGYSRLKDITSDDELKDAIKTYQIKNKNLKPDGEITLPKDTSKPNKSSTFYVLQCDVYKKLGRTPPLALNKVCDAK